VSDEQVMSKKMWKRWIFLFGAIVLGLIGAAGYCRWTGQIPAPLLEILVRRIQVPPGFKIELYATGVPNARSLTLGAGGTVFVGSRRAGKVYALTGNDRHDKAAAVITIARGLDTPNGVAFHDGSLYVAEVSRVLRYDAIEARLKNPPAPVVVSSALPQTKGHEWRFIGFGPDGWLYVGVGAPCNVCESSDKRVASILRMRADGSGMETYALGVRNSVGFDWQAESQEMWFTDNGRDNLGDDIPPDELNYAPRAGMNFGFPYCHGKDISDPEFGREHSCAEFVGPAWSLPAHVAAVGMRFYGGGMFPSEYRGGIFIAEHGSWNRSVPIGYRVSRVVVDGDRAERYEVFAQGWLVGGMHWGRPVDVLVMPDGALLVSDDYAGAVYRISYR
jgi:glucose/arabinose dehydrogenase